MKFAKVYLFSGSSIAPRVIEMTIERSAAIKRGYTGKR